MSTRTNHHLRANYTSAQSPLHLPDPDSLDFEAYITSFGIKPRSRKPHIEVFVNRCLAICHLQEVEFG